MSATQTLSYSCPHCHTTVDVMPHAGQELVTCPACNKPFQVTVPEAEPINHLVTPTEVQRDGAANGTSTTAQFESEEEKRPVLMAENLHEKEEHIRTVSLNMFRRYPLRCVAYSAMIVGGIILAFIFMANEWPVLTYIMFGLSAFGIFRLFMWWARMRNTMLTVTTRRCIVESGFITKEAIEVASKDITGITVGQNFITRLLNVGDLTIVSGGAQAKTVVVMAVPNPAEVATLIRGQGVGAESVPR